MPGKANAELQITYLKQLEEILKTKGKHDAHYYLDGVHPQHNTHLAYGWIKKAHNKFVLSNTRRQRININAALNADSSEVIIRAYRAINEYSDLKLFQTLDQKHLNAKTIFISLDLDLIERLWRFMRQTILYNQYYEKFADFKAEVMQFLKTFRNTVINQSNW